MKSKAKFLFIWIMVFFILPNANAQTPPPASECYQKIPDEVWEEKRYGKYVYPSPPPFFNAAIPWLTITAQKGANTFGTVRVRSLELWEIKNKNETKLFDDFICEICDDKLWGYRIPSEYYRDRDAWCQIGEGLNCKGEKINSFVTIDGTDAVISIEPGYTYHIWNIINRGEGSVPRWRWPATSDAAYYAKTLVQISGEALVNLGMDYWVDPGECPYVDEYQRISCNLEAAATYWACPSPVWQEITTRHSIYIDDFK